MPFRSPRIIRAGERPGFDNDDINWGVGRRPGFSEFDDPSAHRDLIQHAFLDGTDARALCGYRPHRWHRGRSVRVAAATHLNPQCANCKAAMAMSSAAEPFVIPIVPDPLRRVLAWPAAALPIPIAATPVKRRRRARATPANT
jgi:hypothetical protein